MINSPRSRLGALARWMPSALLVLAACEAGPPTATDPIAAVSSPLRVRSEHLLGNGAAGWRLASEPRNLEKLSGIQVRCGIFVDAVRFRYRDHNGNQRWDNWVGGFGGGARPEFLMEPFEKLVLVQARTGEVVDSIKFTTVGPSGNRTYEPSCGTDGGLVSFETGFEGSERYEIHGVAAGTASTTSNTSMAWIRLISYLPLQTVGSLNETEVHVGWGGNGGGVFSLLPVGDEVLQGVQGAINNQNVNFPVLGALRLLFRSRSTGAERWTGWAGNPNLNCNGGCVTHGEFRLLPGEFFTGIVGNAADNTYAITFVTSTGRTYGPISKSVRGGPFGFETRVHGGLRRRIVGLSGRAGERIDRIDVRDGYPDCGHLACVPGGPMVASCDPCVQQICAVDPFCCNNSWDSICVDRVASTCGLNCNPN